MIKKLSLRNFKCFEEADFDLSNLNLLTGLNGMGKSTVIQSLLLLRQNFDRNTLEKRLSLNGDLTQCGNATDVLYQYFNSSEIGIKLQFEDNAVGDWVWDGRSRGDSLNLINFKGVLNWKDHSLFNSQFHYLNAERIGPRPYFETSTHEVINENQLGSRG